MFIEMTIDDQHPAVEGASHRAITTSLHMSHGILVFHFAIALLDITQSPSAAMYLILTGE
jgi:hypothetical protein